MFSRLIERIRDAWDYLTYRASDTSIVQEELLYWEEHPELEAEWHKRVSPLLARQALDHGFPESVIRSMFGDELFARVTADAAAGILTTSGLPDAVQHEGSTSTSSQTVGDEAPAA